MKKKDPVEEVEYYRSELHKDIARWREILANGSSDPFWPDGTNMNLVRNHIINDTRMINSLCEEHGLIRPEEADCVPPPKVDDNLYTGERSGKRYERLSQNIYHVLVFLDEPLPEYVPFPEMQMALF